MAKHPYRVPVRVARQLVCRDLTIQTTAAPIQMMPNLIRLVLSRSARLS